MSVSRRRARLALAARASSSVPFTATNTVRLATASTRNRGLTWLSRPARPLDRSPPNHLFWAIKPRPTTIRAHWRWTHFLNRARWPKTIGMPSSCSNKTNNCHYRSISSTTRFWRNKASCSALSSSWSTSQSITVSCSQRFSSCNNDAQTWRLLW